mgnify:FL=1
MKVENVIENTITLTLPINSLESLLNSFDYIAFIEAIDPPAQDENYYGRAMHGSSNIHLTNGLNYDGTGVTVAIGDGGVSFNHVDFTGKMTIRSTTAAVSSHATHVTGIVGGSGLLNSQHEGMAPGARLLSYNSTSDISAIPTIYNADGVRVTNHSLGWSCDGSYNSSSRTVDLQTAKNEKVNVTIYDITGRLLEVNELNLADTSKYLFGGHYPSGVYNVIVTQGDLKKTVRVVKQ